MTVTPQMLTRVLIVLVFIALYFVPTFIVLARNARNPAPTVLVNLFLGLSIFGWITALVMSLTAATKDSIQAPVTHGLREIDMIASAIVAGTRRSIGRARIVAVANIQILPVAYATSQFATTVGSEVDMYERREGYMLIRTPDGVIGWVPTSAIDLAQISPPIAT